MCCWQGRPSRCSLPSYSLPGPSWARSRLDGRSAGRSGVTRIAGRAPHVGSVLAYSGPVTTAANSPTSTDTSTADLDAGRAPRRTRQVYVANLVAQMGICVTGAVVRLTSSGLGCPTWPKCSGDSITPVSGQVEAWHKYVEFGNRLLTVVLIVLAIAAAVMAVQDFGFGTEAGIARDLYRDIKATDAPRAVERMLKGYLAHRAARDETFLTFSRRHEVEELKAMFEMEAGE